MKIFKSLVIVAAMAAMVVGATSSFFSDTKTIAGNSFTTGSIKIDVVGLPDQGNFTFTDMKPG